MARPKKTEAEKLKEKQISQAVREMSADLRSNMYVRGQMQFTDMTNRDFFLKAFPNQIIYCKEWDKFLVWDKTNWTVDNYGKVEEMAVNFIRDMYRGVRYIQDRILAADFEKHIIKSESLRRIQAMIGLCKMTEQIKVRSDNLDTDNYLFNTKNCSINLTTYTAKDSEQNDFATKCSNVIYDPNAECPTWEKFLMQIFNNDYELIDYVQKAIGYSLSGDVSEQCLFIMWGCGANGKSTFLNTIQEILGDYSCSASTDSFMKKNGDQSNDIARLRGMRLVTTSEVEQGEALSESLIKQITGEDELTARFLYGEYFSFRPTFKIFMATNHKPKIKGSDNGIWRRIKLIPFTVTIPPEQRDKNLGAKLKAEASGILNWMLRGYAKWKEEGLKDPAVVREANEEYRDDMDSVGAFIRECLNVDATNQMRLPNKNIYEVYLKWTSENNESPLTQKGLATRLQEKGFSKKSSNGLRYWEGLSIKVEWALKMITK